MKVSVLVVIFFIFLGLASEMKSQALNRGDYSSINGSQNIDSLTNFKRLDIDLPEEIGPESQIVINPKNSKFLKVQHFKVFHRNEFTIKWDKSLKDELIDFKMTAKNSGLALFKRSGTQLKDWRILNFNSHNAFKMEVKLGHIEGKEVTWSGNVKKYWHFSFDVPDYKDSVLVHQDPDNLDKLVRYVVSRDDLKKKEIQIEVGEVKHLQFKAMDVKKGESYQDTEMYAVVYEMGNEKVGKVGLVFLNSDYQNIYWTKKSSVFKFDENEKFCPAQIQLDFVSQKDVKIHILNSCVNEPSSQIQIVTFDYELGGKVRNFDKKYTLEGANIEDRNSLNMCISNSQYVI